MDASPGDRSSPCIRQQLQGPRPPRLAVSKDSHKVRKPPVALQRHHHPQQQQQQQQVGEFSWIEAPWEVLVKFIKDMGQELGDGRITLADDMLGWKGTYSPPHAPPSPSSYFELPVHVAACSESSESSVSPLPSPSSYLPLPPSSLVACSQSSLPPPSPSCYLPLPPSLIACSQWEKEECIGSGSFGHVYRGFNSEHGHFCAIKEVLVVLNDPRSKEQLKQLNQEICFLKQFSHPNIVQYYGSILTSTALSIYMEYVSEGSIHVLLGKHGPFKESMIRNYTAQILSGLAYLHERRHIHRDIKGANILVGSNGIVKLADFGVAKHVSTLTEVHTSNIGTPYWMAPEVIVSKYSGKGYNLPADIWSLGCTVVEMATGKHPLHGFEPVAAMFSIARDTYEPEIPEKLSDEGRDFLLGCFRRDPRSRPTATQLMDHPFVREYRAAV